MGLCDDTQYSCVQQQHKPVSKNNVFLTNTQTYVTILRIKINLDGEEENQNELA